jgi:1-pyrroline-5-carboxylate dehydrogenase
MGFSQVYVYDDADFDKTLELIDTSSDYALTGAMYVWNAFILFGYSLSPRNIPALPPSAKL